MLATLSRRLDGWRRSAEIACGGAAISGVHDDGKLNERCRMDRFSTP